MQQGKRVGIVGAGVSGLLACKHLVERGLDPVVFESHEQIGGVWVRGAIESTRLQTPKSFYQFSDFPWPESVSETFPDHRQVAEYLDSYAKEFGILPRIRFNSRVTKLEFVGKEEVVAGREEWGGSGAAFSRAVKWKLTVVDLRNMHAIPEVHEVDFVILCIGMFSGLPRKPDFPVNQGPEVFDGKVLHSMDYAMMGRDQAAVLVKDKTVTVVGFQKSALDIAAEISKRNGHRHPCVLLFRKAHWGLPAYLVKFVFGNHNRFKEYMIHKPGEGLFLWLLATLLSPLMWIFTRLIESYLRLKYPLKRYGISPVHSLYVQVWSCMTPTLPSQFYEAIKEGSLVLKKTDKFSFCKNGLIIDGDASKVVETDIVIFATGLARSSAPLYRECIHSRIPQVAILGYSDSTSVLHTTEMRCKWLAHFLAGCFKIPSIQEMEADVMEWERCARSYSKESYKWSRVSVLLQIYCNDILCSDMGVNPRRNYRKKKKILEGSLLTELSVPYGPGDYRDLTPAQLQNLPN